ncbi:DUF692 domain-containing protein [Persephonella sp.]|uniref:DUF692 domain-containing protein n=1 Tax=Persephonella sp. TaxID=2060922 RepID=UPI00260C2537|nr:DUF692 domain-containing protein [Persephonella sp.]
MISGTGLGLRLPFIEEIYDHSEKPEWFEIAPENWIKKGGYLRKLFENLRQDFDFVAHGLSLSIGSPDPVNFDFLKELKDFLDYYQIEIYSEHMSFSIYNGKNSYELLPIPYTEDVAQFISDKINQVQDFLQRPFIFENASTYVRFPIGMDELDFFEMVIEKTDSKMLLDINNIFVNSVNHNFDPYEYIEQIKPEWVAYYHIAGHERIDDSLIIDTHGADIIEEVYKLMDFTLKKIGSRPVLLERDNNIPPYDILLKEYQNLKGRVNAIEKRNNQNLQQLF